MMCSKICNQRIVKVIWQNYQIAMGRVRVETSVPIFFPGVNKARRPRQLITSSVFGTTLSRLSVVMVMKMS